MCVFGYVFAYEHVCLCEQTCVHMSVYVRYLHV